MHVPLTLFPPAPLIGAPSLLLPALEKGAAQAERAGRIVQRMRAVLLKRAPMPVPCDINAAIMAVARLVEHHADRCGARLRVELAQALPQSLADPVMIELVLLNLIQNGFDSMHFTPGPLRELTIRSLPEDERFMRVEVHRGRVMQKLGVGSVAELVQAVLGSAAAGS